MNTKLTTKLLVFLLFTLTLSFPFGLFAKIGVGVGSGKIRIDNPLKAGGIYNLPPLPVLNTGDETAEYQVSVQYHEGQETKTEMGLKPDQRWFNFNPASFSLEPGKVQTVKVTLTLPPKVKPGNYFAYLEARPVKKSVAGQTSIGIAAAAQLWFTVAPANFLQGVYYRLASLYARYYPWDVVIPVILLLAVIIKFLSGKFQFSIVRK